VKIIGSKARLGAFVAAAASLTASLLTMTGASADASVTSYQLQARHSACARRSPPAASSTRTACTSPPASTTPTACSRCSPATTDTTDSSSRPRVSACNPRTGACGRRRSSPSTGATVAGNSSGTGSPPIPATSNSGTGAASCASTCRTATPSGGRHLAVQPAMTVRTAVQAGLVALLGMVTW